MSSGLVDSSLTYGELPSLSPANMTYEELEYKYTKLRRENHQLQLRILGVNELARLLQDRNELVAVLKEKNKRLDVSVVRLENRCANFERQIKSQKSNGVASAKPGQSPFIPGPSKQILQSLWQENEDLKKTVNNMQKKGSSGYLEAVKTTQLEEFIEQQKCEIEQLHKQIDSLATMGEEEGTGPRGAVSLQASVTDSGPLKKQLIKMQQTMMVKDRFCTLLSQQVTELQKKLNTLHGSQVDGAITTQQSSNGGHSGVTDKAWEASRQENQDKMSELQVEVRHLKEQNETLDQKCTDITQLYSAVRAELDLARAELALALAKIVSGNGSESSVVEELRRRVSDLQKTMDDQVDTYNREIRSLENGLKATSIELDESNTKLGTALSQLSSMDGEKKQLDDKLRIQRGMNDKLVKDTRQKSFESQNKQETINHLQEELTKAKDDKEDIHNELARIKEQQLHTHYDRNRDSNYTSSGAPFNLRTGGAPSIFSNISHGQEGMVKDGAHKPELMARGAETPKGHGGPVPGGMGNPGLSNMSDTAGMPGMGGVVHGGRSSGSVVGGQSLHPKPPNALPLLMTGPTAAGSRPRSPSVPPHTRPMSHTPHPSSTPHPSTTSIHTPNTPFSTTHPGGIGRPHGGGSTSPVPIMQPNLTGPNFGMAGGIPMSGGMTLSANVPLFGVGPRHPTSTSYAPRNNPGGFVHSNNVYGRGGSGVGGGAGVRHNMPPTTRPMQNYTAPVHSYSSRPPMEGSYPGGQGGQSGHGAHFSQGSWPGDMRDHSSSGNTSPHHHDNPPHYGNHPHNPNPNYR